VKTGTGGHRYHRYSRYTGRFASVWRTLEVALFLSLKPMDDRPVCWDKVRQWHFLLYFAEVDR
jgi:hypothetical protein